MAILLLAGYILYLLYLLLKIISCAFSSIGYIDHPGWGSHREEAKREPLCEHRITRNAGAMVPLLLSCATPGLASIAAWCASGTTAVVICLHVVARTRQAACAVQGDVVSVGQVLHGTPSTPH